MKRTSIIAEEPTLDRLHLLAKDRDMSFAEIVREALNEKAAQYRPKPTFIGKWESGRSDLSEIASRGTPPPPSWRSS
jgi:hypothetical protein